MQDGSDEKTMIRDPEELGELRWKIQLVDELESGFLRRQIY